MAPSVRGKRRGVAAKARGRAVARRVDFISRWVVEGCMPKRVYEPCLPTVATEVPTGPEWLHELKHDGFRLLIHRDSDDVRLFTRRGYDWTHRFPRVIDQARRLRLDRFRPLRCADAAFVGFGGWEFLTERRR
jgi:ATP-dependent DNA ligase